MRFFTHLPGAGPSPGKTGGPGRAIRAGQGRPGLADEPIDVQGAEGSTILVRRMKQGVAEYFKYQLKAQMWEGLKQYVIGGWNTGKTLYGYQAERSPHPNPVKANMGATRARLIPDPERAPGSPASTNGAWLRNCLTSPSPAASTGPAPPPPTATDGAPTPWPAS